MSGSLNVDFTEARTVVDKHDIKRSKLISFYSVPYDPTTHFFTKFGSSFNQFPNMRTFEHYSEGDPDKLPKKIKEKVSFPVNHLQRIFNLSKNLLTKELLTHLDEQAEDIFQLNLLSNSSRINGYKSFSETITLVIVTLLREILQNQNGESIWFFPLIKWKIYIYFQICPLHSPKTYKNLWSNYFWLGKLSLIKTIVKVKQIMGAVWWISAKRLWWLMLLALIFWFGLFETKQVWLEIDI